MFAGALGTEIGGPFFLTRILIQADHFIFAVGRGGQKQIVTPDGGS